MKPIVLTYEEIEQPLPGLDLVTPIADLTGVALQDIAITRTVVAAAAGTAVS